MRHLWASLEFVDLGIMDEATKFRVLSKCRALDSALHVFEELAAGLQDDDLIPGRTGSVFWRNSMIRSATDDAADTPHSGIRRDSRHLQGQVHRHLRGLRSDIVPLIHLQTRIGMWLPEFLSP
eukprot:1714608-Pyramimonas_sp.AAC.1